MITISCRTTYPPTYYLVCCNWQKKNSHNFACGHQLDILENLRHSYCDPPLFNKLAEASYAGVPSAAIDTVDGQNPAPLHLIARCDYQPPLIDSAPK